VLSQFPTYLVAGPDGAIWFTEAGGNVIVRLSLAAPVPAMPVTGLIVLALLLLAAGGRAVAAGLSG
jgi:hypothetical protein